VAADSARFSEIFARRALSIDFGGSWLLPRLIGLRRAKQMTYLADVFSAQIAYDIGLIHGVVSESALEPEVDALAQRFADGPSVALAGSKRLLHAAFDRTFEAAVRDEITVQLRNLRTADVAEALAAFAERRSPTFHGR